MWSVASGAGAYSKTCLASSVLRRLVIAIARSVDREVIARLVSACALLLDLHQHIVEQRRGAEAESLGRHPVRTEGLIQHHEVGDRLLRGADPTRRLEPNRTAGLT